MAKSFTVVIQKAFNGILKYVPVNRERHAFKQINPDDVAGQDASPDDLKRMLKLLQDNTQDATRPYRTNPLLHGELHVGLAATSGKQLIISHGLAEPYGYWWPVDQSGAAFQGVKVNDPTTLKTYPANRYLVLSMSSTGTYSIVITPS